MNNWLYIFLFLFPLSYTAKGQTSWSNPKYKTTIGGTTNSIEVEGEEKEEKPIKEIKTKKAKNESSSIKKEIFINPISPKDWVHVNSKFGERNHPVLKEKKHHGGIDIPVPTGTPVYAVLSGTILTSAETDLNGKYIKIQHDKGYMTVYLHLSKLSVKNGKRVKQGQIIGYSGATGRVTGPHLHYEVRLNDQQQNPEKFLLFN